MPDNTTQSKPIMSRWLFEVIGLAQFILIYAIVAGVFALNFGLSYVPTASMSPTIQPGSVLLYAITPAEELTYGDIVTFFFTDSLEVLSKIEVNSGMDVLYEQRVEERTVYVKRVIGLPGDVIQIKDGYAWRNGEKLEEEYVSEPMTDEESLYIVPEGHIFCMGDNRNGSFDSRYYGAFPMNTFFGKAIFIFNLPGANKTQG